MKKLMSSICALAMFATMGAIVPASAQPLPIPQNLGTVSANGPVTNVQYNWDRPNPSGYNSRRWDRRSDRRFDRRMDRRDRYSYYRGHRGYRDYRPGYRRHNGFWFPAGAFITGAIVGGAIASGNSGVRVRNYGSAHVDWCSSQYRSYRASDNTFQPYNGGRRTCMSPYN